MTRPAILNHSDSPATPENHVSYGLLTEYLPQYVWTTDAEGKIDYCNRHLLEYCGLTLEQVRAGRGSEFIHPDDLPGLLEKAAQGKATGQPYEHEYRVRNSADGEYRWHFAHCEPFAGSVGAQRWLGIAMDVTSRKQTEFELRAANERLNGFLASIQELFVVLDRDWHIQYLSQRVLEASGMQWAEVRGRVIWDVFPEAAKTEFRPGYEKVMRERVSHCFEVTYPQPDGSISHYQVDAFPTPDGISALVSDITQKRRIEKELEESKRLLDLVLDSAGVGTWIWNVSTGEISDLANTAKLLGLDQLTSLDQFLAALHPDDRASVETMLAEGTVTGRLDAEYRVVRPDGSVRRMRGAGSLMHEQNGQPQRMAGVITDVTDRNRADEVRNRLAAIVACSDDAIISKDLNGVVTSWNDGATRLFGYRPEEIIGRSILTIIPPELQSEEPIILAKLRNGEKIDHHETVRLRKDGTRLQVSLTISPLRDSTGRIVGGSKIARDIGERLRMQEAIIQSEKLAATGRMAAAIAHEINNPLEAVTNLAYLLSTDPSLGDRARHYAELLLEEINRVSDVAKQSLGFFRDSKKPGPFDVCELLDTVVSLYRPLLEKKNIAMARNFTGACHVYGSAAEMRQVFANLVRNAIDATDPGGQIQLRARTTPSGMRRILIADNGRGIAPETRKRLFQPFVTSKGTAGNGLGLWVSQGIVRKHGGHIKVRTSDVRGHSGTVFAVVLPAEASQWLQDPGSAPGMKFLMQPRLAS